ncbi:hypothetical protein KKE06_04595 [Candidatus Micrarchaeota archaeon]|nr:hypothetical protein [Candidatus Micrarchaeota archaeon]
MLKTQPKKSNRFPRRGPRKSPTKRDLKVDWGLAFPAKKGPPKDLNLQIGLPEEGLLFLEKEEHLLKYSEEDLGVFGNEDF